MHEPIIPEDVAAALRAKAPAPLSAAEKKEKERLRGQERRRKAKEEQTKAEAEKKAAEAKTFPEYWQKQRALLTPEQVAEYEQRENDVLDLEHCIKLHLDGRYEAEADRLGFAPEERVSIQDLIEEVESERTTHGLCETVVLVVPNLWKDAEAPLRNLIEAKGGATPALIQFGYRLGLDSQLHERFRQKFMVERKEIGPTFTTLSCVCGQTVSVSIEIAQAYATPVARPYRCQQCLNQSRAVMSRALSVEYRSPENQVFDSWGRVKDQ